VNSKRASDILTSPANIKVMHQGKAVWIEQVDDKFAEIHYLDNRERLRVPVEELMEDESAF
jgi:H-type small acid-soluble spore protein